jgi:hypothetical protein
VDVTKQGNTEAVRGQLKCDGTRAETRFRVSAKRTSPFKSAGMSVQSITGRRGVRISGSNAGYMFGGSVKSTGYPLHSPVSPSIPSRASPCAITFQLESTPAEITRKAKIPLSELELCRRNSVASLYSYTMFIPGVQLNSGPLTQP